MRKTTHLLAKISPSIAFWCSLFQRALSPPYCSFFANFTTTWRRSGSTGSRITLGPNSLKRLPFKMQWRRFKEFLLKRWTSKKVRPTFWFSETIYLLRTWNIRITVSLKCVCTTRLTLYVCKTIPNSIIINFGVYHKTPDYIHH